MRAALISIELFALYILENTPQLSPEAGGVKPLFLVAAALSLTSDEVAAATIYGAVCGVLTEKPAHCGVPGTAERGVRWMTNDAVNLCNNLLGALAALGLYALHH